MVDLSPSDIVREYHERLATRDWTGAAKLYAPAIIERFARRVRGEDPPIPPTAARLQEADPAMPLAVAEYHASKAARAREAQIDESYYVADPTLGSLEIVGHCLEDADLAVRGQRWVVALCQKYPEHADRIEATTRERFQPRRLRELTEIIEGEVACVVEHPVDRRLDAEYPVDHSPVTWMLRLTDAGWRLSQEPPRHNRIVRFAPVQIETDEGERISLTL